MRESAIESEAVAYAVKQGIYVRKFSSPAHRGVPDRLFIHNGKMLFIEFKAPGKRPTALQERELRLINEQGITAIYADNLAAAMFAIQHYLLK